MKPLLLLVILSFTKITSIVAQNQSSENLIIYERSLNMHAFIKAQNNSDQSIPIDLKINEYRKTNPQFLKVNYKLEFDKDHSFFQEIKNSQNTNGGIYEQYTELQIRNTIYTKHADSMYQIEKELFNNKFFIKDKKKQIRWKITNENREILGYTCIRANGVLNDSIYVVAFFTPSIPYDVGPECIGGLPGAILNLYLPDDNVSYISKEINNIAIGTSGNQAFIKNFPKHTINFQQFQEQVYPLIDKLYAGKKRIKRLIEL
ncbi:MULTISPECIES: GLPGLI family protein [Sphingobacterium]|uniref:GLPGLI family protein n=1 Tax=Sphingobacterium TaxID=28453 RepID=UPI00160CABFF|nr:GLPGLI family protein [Sphingobacterium sp. JUb56]MBB2950148.1 GLPGLI family protein [Sphingobacterium sp. JUb56]